MTTDHKALIERLGTLGPAIRFAFAKGQTVDQMREAFHRDPLHQAGDALLIWANEGDLYMTADKLEAAQAIRDLEAENKLLRQDWAKTVEHNTRLKALGDGLAGFTKHKRDCDNEFGGCDCGLSAARAAWDGRDAI